MKVFQTHGNGTIIHKNVWRNACSIFTLYDSMNVWSMPAQQVINCVYLSVFP